MTKSKSPAVEYCKLCNKLLGYYMLDEKGVYFVSTFVGTISVQGQGSFCNWQHHKEWLEEQK